jgi:hypothetical protein
MSGGQVTTQARTLRPSTNEWDSTWERSKTQNALRRHLENHNISLEACLFTLIAHGPIYPEQLNMEAHLPIRNFVGAMEKSLAEELRAAGYNVLNNVKWKHPANGCMEYGSCGI